MMSMDLLVRFGVGLKQGDQIGRDCWVLGPGLRVEGLGSLGLTYVIGWP